MDGLNGNRQEIRWTGDRMGRKDEEREEWRRIVQEAKAHPEL
jgi:hypothetical protein